ncbi:MAG: hypothetical protein IJV98_00575 [Clostridia bacterium]|nr:hypothetical protein [Clostridia bacterium]
MKKYTGNLSRMTLSYDMTFFALVRTVLAGEDYTIRKRRCAVHPMRSRPMMDDNGALAYAAYVSALLTAYKIDDTALDERGLVRLAARTAGPYARRLKRRAERAAYEIRSVVKDAMDETRRLENEACDAPDLPADVFGRMLGELLAMGLDGIHARLAYEIGLHTGRFVYIIDAVCDYEQDLKKHSYNPFIHAFDSEEEMKAFRQNTLRGVLMPEIDAILRAVYLMDFEGKPMFRECIENIITDGMGSALSIAVGKEGTDGKGSL